MAMLEIVDKGVIYRNPLPGHRVINAFYPSLLWDAYGRESLRVARTATYPSSHDAIAYGAPKIIRLDGDHAMASFWCTQGADTHCRWCKIRIV